VWVAWVRGLYAWCRGRSRGSPRAIIDALNFTVLRNRMLWLYRDVCASMGVPDDAISAKHLPEDVFRVPHSKDSTLVSSQGTTLTEAFDVYFLLKLLGDYAPGLAKHVGAGRAGRGWLGGEGGASATPARLCMRVAAWLRAAGVRGNPGPGCPRATFTLVPRV
jgi:hypothetical protein